jgi:hypothetical protein
LTELMPIKKFRDISEMTSPVHRPGSAELAATIRLIWRTSRQICPLHFPPGVYKHRSIEEAERLRHTWQQANVQAQQLRIRKPKPAL